MLILPLTRVRIWSHPHLFDFEEVGERLECRHAWCRTITLTTPEMLVTQDWLLEMILFWCGYNFMTFQIEPQNQNKY